MTALQDTLVMSLHVAARHGQRFSRGVFVSSKEDAIKFASYGVRVWFFDKIPTGMQYDMRRLKPMTKVEYDGGTWFCDQIEEAVSTHRKQPDQYLALGKIAWNARQEEHAKKREEHRKLREREAREAEAAQAARDKQRDEAEKKRAKQVEEAVAYFKKKEDDRLATEAAQYAGGPPEALAGIPPRRV